MTDDLRRSVFEGFFGRDALQPTVVGQPLVVREIQTHNQSDALVIIGFLSAGLFFLRFLCLWFLALRFRAPGFRGWNLITFRSVGRRLIRGLLAFSLLVGGGLDFGAFKLKQEFLIQAEGLLPALDAVAGLLRSLLVRPEIENQIGLRHVLSYSGPGAQMSSRGCG